MRICIPIRNDDGMESVLHDHFGSAPLFALADTETGGVRVVENRRHDHEHGKCRPIDHIDRDATDAVVCRGMGRRALASLEHGGMRVLVTTAETLGQAISQAREGSLRELTLDEACGGHSRHHGGGRRHGRTSSARRQENRRLRQGR